MRGVPPFGLPKISSFVGGIFSHLCRFSAVVDQCKEGDFFGSQNWAVSLLEGDAGAFLQQLLDREGRFVLDALAADRGDGLSRWLRQGPRCWARFGRTHAGRCCCRRWGWRRCRRLDDGGGWRLNRGNCARSGRLREAFGLWRRHDHLGNSNRAGRRRGRCRRSRCRRGGRAGRGFGWCAGLGWSGSRLLGVRLWRARRFRWWRGGLLASPRHRNERGAHEQQGKRQYWPMVPCPVTRPAESRPCSQGSSDRHERG